VLFDLDGVLTRTAAALDAMHRGAALGIEGGVAPEGPPRAKQIVILSGVSLAHNAGLRQAEDGAWEIHGDPTEAAFLVAERKLGVEDRRQERFERIGATRLAPTAR